MRNFSFLTAIALTWGCTPPGTPGKAELTAAPNPVQFGQVAVDQTATKQVVIKNIGTAEVTVTSSIAASSFIVPGGNLTIAAGGSTTVTLRFRPTRIATTSEDWVLAERGQAPLLKLTLRGEGVAPCTDADSDGAQANCTTGTDCDDTNPAVHPGAIERCNGGIDDDCDPATVEVCAVDGGRDAGPADAGPRDAGPPDAGPCTCTDDPTDCLGLNACYRDAGAAVCTTFDQPDLTSCRRSAVDGGIGVCLRASCVECFNASDCIALNASATTCDFVSCTNNRCDSVRRHDNTAWRVNPPMSPEILVSPGATPIKAMWDGQNFAVAVTTLDGGAVVKRLTPAGIILDPVGYRLSPRVKDIAFSGDRFLQVTQEPANGGAQPWAYIAGSYLSYDGGANSAPTPLIWDTTRVNGHFVAPSVAGSSQGSFMVVAGASQYSWVKWRQFPGAAGEIAPPFLPDNPMLTGSPNGYSLTTQESLYGLGDTEVGGAFFGRVSGDTGYAVRVPFQQPDLIRGSECCTQAARLATNGTTFLLAYTWGGLAALYRPYDLALQPTAMPTQYALGGAVYSPGQFIELTSDGVNYLIVQAPSGSTLRVFRVDPTGVLLDAPTFDVSSTDSNVESKPQLVSDGQGRNLLAYQKVEGTQTNTYVRLFTTCP